MGMMITINIQRMPSDIRGALGDYIAIIRNTLLQLKRLYPIRVFVGRKYGTVLTELLDDSLNPYVRNALKHAIAMEEPRAFDELALSLLGDGWDVNKNYPFSLTARLTHTEPKRYFSIFPTMIINGRVYGKYGVIAYVLRAVYAEAYGTPPVTDTVRMYNMILQHGVDTITI
jgi:hypothetical protein